MSAGRNWLHEVLVAIDQVVNAILGGWSDESISARSYRLGARDDAAGRRGRDLGSLLMARYALIRADVVVNVARAEPDWPGLADFDQAVELAEDQAVAPGHTYDGSVFAAPAPRVPAAVTMRQARLALLGANLLSSVDTAIDALPEPTKSAARIEWEYRDRKSVV